MAARTTISATSAAAAAAAICCGFLSSQAQKITKTGCIRTRAAMSPRENTGGDRLARPVHRGVGSSLRMVVQHARVVVVGATSYTTMVACSLCGVVRETEWSVDPNSIFGSQHCVERDFVEDGDDIFRPRGA